MGVRPVFTLQKRAQDKLCLADVAAGGRQFSKHEDADRREQAQRQREMTQGIPQVGADESQRDKRNEIERQQKPAAQDP